MSRRIRRLPVWIWIGITVPACLADDWPGWRGPHRNGISVDSIGKAEGIETDEAILWKREIGAGHSSVAVFAGRAYTMGNKRIGGLFHDIVYGLDIRTGASIWEYAYRCDDVAYPGPRATPRVHEGRVYTLSWDGRVNCLDAESGALIWSRQLVDEGLAEVPGFGFSGSPVIVDDVLLLNAATLGIALNKDTGAVLWASEAGAGMLTTPLLFMHDRKTYAAIPKNRALYAVDVHTGESVWWYPWYRSLDIDPLMADDLLFLPGYKGSMLLSVNGPEHRVLMENRDIRFTAYLNAVMMDGFVFGFADFENRTPLQCVDIHTGEVLWREELGMYGSISATDGKLIVVSGSGELIIAEASSEAFRPLARRQVIERPLNATDDPGREWCCWTQPVLSGGCIFVRSNYGQLSCVDVRGDLSRDAGSAVLTGSGAAEDTADVGIRGIDDQGDQEKPPGHGHGHMQPDETAIDFLQ